MILNIFTRYTLHTLHEKWLAKENEKVQQIPVRIINVEGQKEQLILECKNLKREVLEKFPF